MTTSPGTKALMTADGFCLFDTAIGHCGIAWTAHGIAGIQLPERSEQHTRARLRMRFRGAAEMAPPAAVAAAVEAIAGHLRGEPADLASIPLDMTAVPAFHRQVYAVARTIPSGTTWSYGQLAARAGAAGMAREVGQALGQNPFAIVVPCHRVVAAGGRTGGFSARGGVTTKLRLLAIEGWCDGPLFARPRGPA